MDNAQFFRFERATPGLKGPGLIALAALLGACTIGTPRVSLTPARNIITLGESTSLTPQFPGKPGSASIDNGIGPVVDGVPVPASPALDTTYTLAFRGMVRIYSASAQVRVVPAPAITGFAAAAARVGAGSGTTLTAEFQDGAGIIEPGLGAVTSGVPVPTGNLSRTTTFTLTVSNAAGTRVTRTLTVQVSAAPGALAITAPAAVTAGATGLVASVPAQAGSTCAWTVTGGTLTAGAGTPAITFTAGASGTVELTCAVTDATGRPAGLGTASCAIVPAPLAPVISAPATVGAGATGVAASVPAQAGVTFAWTLSGGAITGGSGTGQITFDVATSGTARLACVATNAAGTASAAGTAAIGIVPAAGTPVITCPSLVNAGQAGYSASVPAVRRGSYAWTLTGGALTAGQGSAAVTFTAGASGWVRLGCVVTSAAGIASPQGIAYCAIGPAAGAGIVGISLSGTATRDWASIGVKLLGISLLPEGSAEPLAVYAAPVPAPVTDLARLDRLGELLADARVPPGRYAGAVLTLGANPGDVVLVASAEPSAGFQGAPATAIAPGQIQVQGAAGAPGGLAAPVTVALAGGLVVAAGQRAPLDFEFDLAHPAFLVDHRAAGEGTPTWAVTFNGPVRHHPAGTGLELRDLYGTVTAVAQDPPRITVLKVNPAWPATDPETAQPTPDSLEIQADPAGGTLFHDLDANASGSVQDFTGIAGALAGRFVRVAARDQADGSLAATRIWASQAYSALPAGPEGLVLHADPAPGIQTGASQDGIPVPLQALPRGRVASPWSEGSASFGLVLPGGASLVNVDLDLAGGSTLVYRVDRSGGQVAVIPVELAGAAGQSVLAGLLVNDATVRVFGSPGAGGRIQASALLVYTGTVPD